MQWIRSHLSFANAISMIALFVALGGTSIAAVSLAKNSVGPKQIKKNGVKASEIARNAVGASEIRSNAVAGGDVADGSIGSLDIGDNAVGAGELGDNAVGSGEIVDESVGSADVTDGSLGENDLQAGLLNFPSVTVQRTDVPLPDGQTAFAEATCLEGQKMIGGGGSVELTTADDIHMVVSRPGPGTHVPNDNAEAGVTPGFTQTWRVGFRNVLSSTPNPSTIRSFVLCVPAG